MEWITKKNVLIAGLGLMGGSYARALKRLGFHVMALDRDEEAVSYALRERIISEGAAGENDELVRKADAVILALYPGIVPQWVQEHQHLFRPGIMMTDVTGVKRQIVYKVQEILQGHNDHRIVMALAVLCTRTGGVIDGAEAVRKSYPAFWDALRSIGANLTVSN